MNYETLYFDDGVNKFSVLVSREDAELAQKSKYIEFLQLNSLFWLQ